MQVILSHDESYKSQKSIIFNATMFHEFVVEKKKNIAFIDQRAVAAGKNRNFSSNIHSFIFQELKFHNSSSVHPNVLELMIVPFQFRYLNLLELVIVLFQFRPISVPIIDYWLAKLHRTAGKNLDNAQFRTRMYIIITFHRHIPL